MKNLFLISLLLIVSQIAYSQQGSNAYHRLADSLFVSHNYQSAATYYEKSIKNSVQPGNSMLCIARCYIRMNQINEAGEWFQKAKENRANFTTTDRYDYVQVLLAQQKKKDVEDELKSILTSDSNANRAKILLDDLQHTSKYYLDSASLTVEPLSINTPTSEFAPAYYKDGIVYTAAQKEGTSKKKYHWDNSDFLNLYYTTKAADGQFQKPSLLNKKLDSRYHDGPAAFYDGDTRMIVNRNIANVVNEKDVQLWHLSINDAHYIQATDTWELTALPFNEPPYSMGHPSISEDGNVLYFASDKPGGYGGSDIYKAVRVNGVWQKPFNLGPNVNTAGNDIFPFFTGKTLYFASNGRGGLGGLDIYKSALEINGFTPAHNMGYPINSTADDFAFITKPNPENGYFSSTRNGNDDLFTFQKKQDLIKILAYVFDGTTKNPLPNVPLQLITSTDEDKVFNSDKDGFLAFELSRESAYVLIADHQGKTGMVSNFAIEEEDYKHTIQQIPLYGHTSRIACVGTIESEIGLSQNATTISIVDKTSGEKMDHDQNKSIVSFSGEKGHNYSIEIKNENGEITSHELVIQPDETGTKTWKMVLRNAVSEIHMAARVFNAENNQPLSGALTKIITFSEPDQELIADADGIVNFTLAKGTAFVIVGSKDNLTGMHSGVVEEGQDSATIVHPVPTHGDPLNPLPVVILTSNSQGTILDVIITAQEKKSGKSIPVQMKDGIVSFFGERGKEYDIHVSAEGFHSISDEVAIASDATTVDKLSIVMQEEKILLSELQMAARIFKKEDNSSLIGANVVITSLIEAEKELVADNMGVVEFELEEGSAYIIIASKDNYYGMYTGIAEKESDKNFIIHPVPATKRDENKVDVVAKIANPEETSIKSEDIIVKEKSSGQVIPTDFVKGMLSFKGEKGKDYTILVDTKIHALLSEEVNIPIEANAKNPIVIPMIANSETNQNKGTIANTAIESDNVPVVGHIKNQEGTILDEVVVTVTDKRSGQKIHNKFKNGLLNFSGDKGSIYIVSVEKQNQVLKTEEVMVPEHSADIEKFNIVLASTTVENRLAGRNELTNKQPGTSPTPNLPMGAHVFNGNNQIPLSNAQVQVISFDQPDMTIMADGEGNVEFKLPEGSAFIIIGTKDQYSGMFTGIAEQDLNGKKTIHPVPTYALKENDVAVVGLLTDDNGQKISSAKGVLTNRTSGQKIQAAIENGVMSFIGEKNTAYSLSIEIGDHSITAEEIVLNESPSHHQMITVNLPYNQNALPVNSSLIILNDGGSTSKFYISSNNSLDEIIERDGTLYLQRGEGNILLGNLTMEKFRANLTQYKNEFEMTFDDIIILQNIYFDFNKATLDADDKKELDKASIFLERYPELKLFISAHADDRGSDNYNLNLSKRRAKSIENFLVKKGIKRNQVKFEAMGETIPAIPCFDGCDEEQYQKNRRAEFSLASSAVPPVLYADKSKSNPSLPIKSNSSRFAELLETYGGTEIEGLYFKINIGAYRLNHNLVFDNLSDLGKIEKENVDGITYYYLSSYSTFRSAESVRQGVVGRGVKDAFISIYYGRNKISFKEFIKLAE